MLRVNNIVVRYGGVEALKGVSLYVQEGEIVALLGANGAGKTTCLRAISALTPVASGEIWFNDQRIDRMPPQMIVKLGISHVPEGKRLFPALTVYNNLISGAYLRGDRDGIKRDLENVYELFPVLKRASRRRASSLSGGEQQMLAVGRALMSKPKILLLDEPSLGLSPILTREVAKVIKRIVGQGFAALLVEQNARMALNLASRGYVLKTGEIVLEDDAKRLLNREDVKKAYLGM